MTPYERLQTICEQHGTTVTRFCFEIKNSKGNLATWKRGNFSAADLTAIHQRFGVSIDWLLFGEKESTEIKPVPRVMLKTKFQETDKETGIVYEYPVNKQCPICQFPNTPDFKGTFRTFNENNKSNFDSRIGLFACGSCGKIFSVLYEKPIIDKEYTGKEYARIYSSVTPLTTVDSCYTPYQPPLPEIRECFDEVHFAKFREAYKDVCLAESFGIKGLVGMAYRRAVEFLVKDYAVLTNISITQANGRDENLKAVIEQIKDERVKAFAASTNVIANDYTHYADHHTDRDIEDIKKFFNMLLLELEKELEFVDSLTIEEVQKYSGLQKPNKEIKNTTIDKKSIATEFAITYENLIQDKNFQKTTKLFDYIDASVRLLAYNVIREWLYNRGIPVKLILGE